MTAAVQTIQAALRRYGGILVAPRATLEALDPREGRYDAWILAALFVLGSQVEHIVESVARYVAFRSVLVLVNGLAITLLTPLLVGLIVESVVGSGRRRYRNLPVVALVVVAVLGNLLGQLLDQQGVELPGPRVLPELLGTAWAAGLALWIRKSLPEPADSGMSDDETAPTVEHEIEATHD